MKPRCYACGLDTVVLKGEDPKYPAVMLCTGCGDRPRRCTCPPVRKAGQ